MQTTFHADLLNVDLGLFVEHISMSWLEILQWTVPKEVKYPDGAPMLLFTTKNGHVQGIPYDSPNPSKAQVEIKLSKRGSIEVSWELNWYSWYEEHLSLPHPEGLKAYDVDINGNLTAMTAIESPLKITVAELRAIMYRRDRVGVIVSTQDNGQWVQRFRSWVELRWGKKDEGYIELELDDALVITEEPQKDITRREQEVLNLIMQGYGNTEIAEQLILAMNTIKSHKENISVKLGMRKTSDSSKIQKFVAALQKKGQ